MNDEERVRLATRSGDRMLGPKERQRCAEHRRKWEIYRWTWPFGGSPESGEVECVRSCNHPDHDEDDE